MGKFCLCLAVWGLLTVSLVWGVGRYVDSLDWPKDRMAELQKNHYGAIKMAGTAIQGEKEWRTEVFNVRGELHRLLTAQLTEEDKIKAVKLINSLEEAGEKRGERKVWNKIAHYLTSQNVQAVNC